MKSLCKEALVPYLQHPDFQIHSLKLDWNQCIGDAGAMALAEALLDVDYPASLVELNLNGCEIGTAGIMSLLMVCHTLQHLKILRRNFLMTMKHKMVLQNLFMLCSPYLLKFFHSVNWKSWLCLDPYLMLAQVKCKIVKMQYCRDFQTIGL
jgi:hypothetical protein